MEMENEKKPIVKEEELYEIANKIFSGRKIILRITIAFFIIGIVIAFSGIKEYTADVSMAPETEGNTSLGGLSSLASMAGVNIGSLGNNNDALYPLLYPDIINSLPFLTSLLDVPVQTIDGSVDSTYLFYRREIQRRSWIDVVIESPKKLAKSFISLFAKKQYWVGDVSKFDPYYLSEKQFSFIESMKKDLSINIDKKTDVISISFTAQDPKVAAIMVDVMRVKLKESITLYRTKKSESDYLYVEKIYNEAKKDYESSQMRYAEFCEKNRNVTSELLAVEKDRLEADKDLKNTIYVQLAQQLQVSKAKIQQETPAFTILKPASIPSLPSTPRKLTKIFMFVCIGLFLGTSHVLFHDKFKQILNKIFMS